jgi:hypothetical protein
MPRRIALSITALSAFTALVACGGCGNDRLPTGTVRGTVTLDGKPLTAGYVVCTPSTGGRGAKGGIHVDGTFELYTDQPGDGVVTGHHRLAVSAFETAGETARSPEESTRKPLVPARYMDAGRSGFTVEVVAGEQQEITLSLTSSP